MKFGWIGKTVMAAAETGVDVRPELIKVGIGSPAGTIDDQTDVGPAEYLLMCVLIINAVDDEMHGASSNRATRGTANLVVKSIAAAPNLQAAIDTIMRFFAISGAYCRVHLEVLNGEARILVRSDVPDMGIGPVVEEMFVSFLHIQLSHYLGFLLPVSEFGTISPVHPYLGKQHPYLLGTVSCSNTTCLAFPAEYLALPSRISLGRNPLLDGELAWISKHAALRSGDIEAQEADSLGGDFYRQLLRQDLAFDQCCRVLNLTQAEARRGLWQEGASFRELRRAALVKRSRAYLEKGVSVEELAEALGYSDGRSIRRALKIATGLNISELRSMEASEPSLASSEVIARLADEKRFQI